MSIVLKTDFYFNEKNAKKLFRKDDLMKNRDRNTPREGLGKPCQPVYIDYIIRIMLCRVYVNV